MESNNQLMEKLLQEEKDYQFKEFPNNTAYEIGSRIIEKSLKEGKQILVEIQKNGEQLFYTKMNGATENNDNWVRRKNNTVRHFNHSSYYMHVLLKETHSNIEAHSLDSKDYAAEGGAFPIIIKDQGIVGTITVSGLTGAEDHGMVTSILSDFFK